MLSKARSIFANFKLASLLTAAILFNPGSPTRVNAADGIPATNGLASTPNKPERHLIAIKSTPWVANGAILGMVVVYDDPSTARTEDFIEIYNRAGNLVAVTWFDRFGIQRVAVDRAFAEGKGQPEGVFITVVDRDFI